MNRDNLPPSFMLELEKKGEKVNYVKNNPEKTRCVIANVRATMAVEGIRSSTRAKAIGRQYLEGKISSKEAIDKIRKQHASDFGK